MKKISLFIILLFTSCQLAKEEIRLGAQWERVENISNNFTERRNFGTVVVDDKIVVIGGYIWKNNREELANDVWVSENKGRTWEQVKTNTLSPTETFTKRQKFGTVVISNDIYIIGGYSDTGDHLNDVWKSSDLGKTWIEVVKNAEFSKRYGHKAVAMGNDIYIIGGYDGRKYYNEIWKSKNLGKTWEKSSFNTLKPRQGLTALNYKNELFVSGGYNGEILTDVWRTENNGSLWYKQLNTPFEIFEIEMVEVNRDLFVIEQDNVWKSIDEGMTWIKVIFNAPFEPRAGYGMVNIGKELILIGGRSVKNRKYLNDVWISKY